MNLYAIGDIHGQLALLQEAHQRIARDQADYGPGLIVHLGDYVDRGPDSRGVLDFLIAGMEAGKNWLVLKGNHDRMFTGFLNDPAWQDPGLRSDLSWLHWRLGGAATLASYGVKNAADRPVSKVHAEAVAAVPPHHRRFIDALPDRHQTADAVFVHAGLRPGIPLATQNETDLVWIRQGFLEVRDSFGALVVHGHTAIDAPTHYGNRVNLDSGAAYGGPLTAAVIQGYDVSVLTAQGRRKLPITPDAPDR
jgi:serine/threonine protein phosphatase 1